MDKRESGGQGRGTWFIFVKKEEIVTTSIR